MKTFSKSIVGFCIATFIASSAFAQTLTDGIRQIELEQYNTAKTTLQNVEKKEPTNARVKYYLGELELHNKNTDAAASFFNQGKTIDFTDAYNHLGLLKVAMLKNDATAIPELLKTVTGKAGKDPIIYVKLAILYAEQPKPDFVSAKLYLEKAKKIKETEPEVYIGYGDVNALEKKTGEAANNYELALYQNKNSVKAYYRLGNVYKRGRNFKQSESNLLKAIELDPNYIPAYRTISELYIMAGKFDKASDNINKCISISEPDIELKSLFSRVQFLNKDFDGAYKTAQEVLAIDKNDANAWRIMAYTANEKNDTLKGLDAIKTFFSLATEDKIISMDYECYGSLLAKMNSDSLAAIQYTNAFSLDSSKIENLEIIAKMYEKKKSLLNTAQAYENVFTNKTLANIPIKSSEYMSYGRSCYSFIVSENGKKDTALAKVYAVKADSAFSKVTQLSPSSHQGFLFRARTNASMDPTSTLGLGKPFYDKVILILEATPDKSKKDLLEAYKYMGFFYYVKYEAAVKANKSADKASNKELSKQFWNKAQSIDPTDVQAIEALKFLNK